MFVFSFRMNGGMEHRTPGHSAVVHKAPKNYKLLMDPFLVKGATKLYRYDGQVPGDTTYPPVLCRDPRSTLSRIWNRLEPADLPVPRYNNFHYIIVCLLSKVPTDGYVLRLSAYYRNILYCSDTLRYFFPNQLLAEY